MPAKKAKEPKPPKEKKVKAPKEKKPKKPRPPKAKKPKKGVNAPEEAEELEEGEGEEPKKKKPLILVLLPVVVIVAAAVIVFLFVIKPKFLDKDKDPDVTPSVEPQPPELPSELPVGEEIVPGMALEADESGALAEQAKTITYFYTNLNDAGKAAQTYVGQLEQAEPRFYIVDEEFVRQTDKPNYEVNEGMVLLARNITEPEPEATPTPEPSQEPEETDRKNEDAEQSPSPSPSGSQAPEQEVEHHVLTVRITWTPGQCVVTADEAVGSVTSPPREPGITGGQSISIYDAQDRISGMDPAQLGLEGESMDGYEVVPMDGTELVDGSACIRVNVYSSNTQGSTMFQGSYLMSLDGQHLYRLNPTTNAIEELDF